MVSVSTITQRASDFTSRDFDSWILELRARANTAFPGWTDYNTANFGNMLLEMYAHTLDVLSFTQDQQYRETRIVFARLRRSMIGLGKLVGFTLPGATVATADLEITIADGVPRATSITIPKGTVIQTPDLEQRVEFDLLADVVIPAGSTQVTLAGSANSRERSQDLTADGSPSQPFILAQTPYVGGSADGNVVFGVDTYTEVDNFLSSGPTDTHFRVDVDDNEQGTLVFGDGINGKQPLGAGSVIYRTGGGSAGNVDPNTLREFRDTNRYPTVSGEQVALLVRNPVQASGGVDRMSVEEARIAIPASVRTSGNRSVTRDDFEDNALKVRGVARSMMLTSDDDASIPENTGELYIVPVGGGLPSGTLKAEVQTFIQDNFPPTLTFTFTVEDPILNVVSVSATVFLALGVTEAVARQAIEDSLDQFFALVTTEGAVNRQIDFGFKIRDTVMPVGSTQGELPWSDMFNAIRDAADPTGKLVLRKVDEDTVLFATLPDDVVLLDKEFPVLGSIALVNGDTLLAF